MWPEPKSEAGKRALVLVEPTRQELLAHRDRQAAEAATNPLWHYGPGGGWAFSQPDGGPVDPRQDNRDFKRLMAAAGISEKRLHDLRHSAATMMRGVGLDLVGAGEVLGQSSTAQTAACTHVLEDRRVQAARLVGEAFFGTQPQPEKPRRRGSERGSEAHVHPVSIQPERGGQCPLVFTGGGQLVPKPCPSVRVRGCSHGPHPI